MFNKGKTTRKWNVCLWFWGRSTNSKAIPLLHIQVGVQPFKAERTGQGALGNSFGLLVNRGSPNYRCHKVYGLVPTVPTDRGNLPGHEQVRWLGYIIQQQDSFRKMERCNSPGKGNLYPITKPEIMNRKTTTIRTPTTVHQASLRLNMTSMNQRLNRWLPIH